MCLGSVFFVESVIEVYTFQEVMIGALGTICFGEGGYFVSLTEDWMVAAAREKLMLIFETKSFIVEPRHSYTLSSGDK